MLHSPAQRIFAFLEEHAQEVLADGPLPSPSSPFFDSYLL